MGSDLCSVRERRASAVGTAQNDESKTVAMKILVNMSLAPSNENARVSTSYRNGETRTSCRPRWPLRAVRPVQLAGRRAAGHAFPRRSVGTRTVLLFVRDDDFERGALHAAQLLVEHGNAFVGGARHGPFDAVVGNEHAVLLEPF